MSGLEDFKDELETCFGTSCGFCERGCPVYQNLKVKTLCMKGRNRTMLGLLQGKFEISPAVVQAAFECTLCGNCDRWCALKNTEHTQAFREYLLKHGVEPMKEHSSLAASLRNYGNPWFQPRTARNRWTKGLNIPKAVPGKAEYLFFAGCTSAVNKQLTKSLVASAKLLQKAGVEFATLGQDEPCCGSTLQRIGQTEAFDAMASENIARLESLGTKKVITPCPGCYVTLKKSAEKYKSKVKVVHVSQEIAHLVKEGKLEVKKSPERMTYHDPCHLGRLGGVFDEPRTIIEAVGTLVEMPNNRYESRCCGAGAGLQSAFPKLLEGVGCEKSGRGEIDRRDHASYFVPLLRDPTEDHAWDQVANLMELFLESIIDNEKKV